MAALFWLKIMISIILVSFVVVNFQHHIMLVSQECQPSTKLIDTRQKTQYAEVIDFIRANFERLDDRFEDIKMGLICEAQVTSNSQIDDRLYESTSTRAYPYAHKYKELGPSAVHEELRRKISSNIQELWFFLKSQLKSVSTINAEKMLDRAGQQIRHMVMDMQLLTDADEAATWRRTEHLALQDIVQQRLMHLQNPVDCLGAKKLVYDISREELCGYACILHHIIYCLMLSYGTERTLILSSKGWKYAPEGWESMFLPLSETCLSVQDGETVSFQDVGISDEKVISVNSFTSEPPLFVPPAVPEDLYYRLSRSHSEPHIWFIGQFLKYILRPQPNLQKYLNESEAILGFKKPIIGIHIRRTDKLGTEAAFHSIEEYMEHAEEWFLTQEIAKERIDKRRVYLASDDPSVLQEARDKYPAYEFIGNISVMTSADPSLRFSEDSLRGIILDIHLLSLCNFIVCTFSSNICRAAYELMQTLSPDASGAFRSLDDVFWFAGQQPHDETVLYAHVKSGEDEIDLEPEDTIHIAGNHWNGFKKGTNRRTGQTGFYPSFKTQDKHLVVAYPHYSSTGNL